MQTVAVIDFETTGLSPAMGDRATDAAVVMVADGKIANNRGQRPSNDGGTNA